jgi:hypothetical protein
MDAGTGRAVERLAAGLGHANGARSAIAAPIRAALNAEITA